MKHLLKRVKVKMHLCVSNFGRYSFQTKTLGIPFKSTLEQRTDVGEFVRSPVVQFLPPGRSSSEIRGCNYPDTGPVVDFFEITGSSALNPYVSKIFPKSLRILSLDICNVSREYRCSLRYPRAFSSSCLRMRENSSDIVHPSLPYMSSMVCFGWETKSSYRTTV